MSDLQILGSAMLLTPFFVVAHTMLQELGWRVVLAMVGFALIVSVFFHTAIRLLLGAAT